MSSFHPSAATWLRLLVLGTIWGTSFLWIKLALADVSPAVIVVARCGLGALIVCGFLASRRAPIPRDPKLWGHLLVIATTGMVIPFTLFGIAEHTASTGLAGALNSTTPLFTALLSLVFLRGRTSVTNRTIAGLMLGFGGAVVMLRPWEAAASVVGAVLCLLAAASYGVTFVYQARFVMGTYPATTLAGLQLALAAPLAAVTIPFSGPNHPPEPMVVVALVLLGVFCTGIAQILNYQIIASAGPVVASSVTYLIPAFAIAIGALFLHEPLPWTTGVGAAAALAGVALTRSGS